VWCIGYNGPHKEGGGDPGFFKSAGELRGTKRDLSEGGIRIPFIAKWDGVVKPGTSSEHVGAFWDMFATFAALANVRPIQKTDGISIVPVLTQKKTQQQHDYLYWEFHEQGGKQAVRKGKWKAIRLQVDIKPNGPVELYDLSKDAEEKNNLAGKYPGKARELEILMKVAHTRSTLFPFKNE